MQGESNSMSEKNGSSIIIFGFVGAIGSDFNLLYNHIETIMSEFNYDTEIIQLSKLIKENEDLIKKVDPSIELKEYDPFGARASNYMKGGNVLRFCSGNNSFLALEAIKRINNNRDRDKKKNIVYILNSFKHPDEIAKIRECYGSIFFLIGAYSSENKRKEILKKKDVTDLNIRELIKRDENENEDYFEKNGDIPSKIKNHPKSHDYHKSCQKTGNAYKLADIYVSLDAEKSDVKKQIKRFIGLLFGDPKETPSKDEYGMYHAYSAALRSGDLSRQVGASILTASGDLISTGCNEVPQAGGGLYWPGNDDKRDLILGYESNKKQLKSIIDDIAQKMQKSGVEQSKIDKTKDLLSHKGELKIITEYGRAVHAEMEAILSCCRNGITTKDCIMYVTLFSCHNCTKHLICAGIKKVIYVEHYPKSFAEKLHGDAIRIKNPNECDDEENKVSFEPFIGISGRRYFDFFSLDWGSGNRIKRMDDTGKLIKWEPKKAEFRFKVDSKSHEPNEKNAIEELKKAKGCIPKK